MNEFKRLNATHGVICSMPKSYYFCCFGRPSITKSKEGNLIVGASGLRHKHVPDRIL